MESEIDELVAKFCGVTTANPEQAQFFLESTEWHLEPALQLFFDSDSGANRATVMSLEDYDLAEDENMAMISDHTSAAPTALMDSEEAWEPIPPEAMAALDPPFLSSLQETGSGRRASALMDNEAWEPMPPEAMASPDPPPGKRQETGSGRRASAAARLVTTLRDLGKHHDSDSDSEDQEYYTGGEKSGMVVQDPAKKMKHGCRRGSSGDHHVEPTVLRAQDSGSGVAEAPQLQRFFLGSSMSRQQSEKVVSPQVQAASPAPAAIAHTVRFWRNGFTVNEGPLRRLDDVSNLPFLESISRSECPRELESTDGNIPVSVNLVKSITEDCPALPREPEYVPFKGLGRTLGTKPEGLEERIAPSVDASRSSPLTIDDASPVTSIQLRLSDGTRMVARFNTTHTVADIRGFIDAARPAGSGPYQLQTMGFPPVKLTNPKQTIEGAGLLNAVVIQKG